MTQSGEIAVSGPSLFAAAPCRVVLHPADGQGIFFEDTKGTRAPALIDHVVAATGPLGGRNTVLAREDFSIATVEHLLSALAGLGIWNARCVVDAGELPILDGSALAFAQAASRLARSVPAPITLSRALRVEDASGAWIEASPADAIEYRYELRYPAGSGLPDQDFVWRGDSAAYLEAIAPARTFSLEREAIAMKQAGLFPHLTAKDMLVIAPDGEAIENRLRFPDEPVRHKLLDLIGDLALLGRPLRARVVAHKSSHALTHQLCRAIASMPPV